MSSLYRLIYRRFCTASLATTVTEKPLNTIVLDLFRERNFDTLVSKFKKSSESSRFRCKHSIYEATVRRLALHKRLSGIEEILEEQKKYKDITNEGFAVRLISLYGKSGMFSQASRTFDQLPELKCPRTVKSFNALLSACVDSKKFDKAEPLFRELSSSLSIEPNLYSYNIIIQALCQMGSLDSALSVLDEMEKGGVNPSLVTFNVLLSAFYEKNPFSDGEKIWARMENNNFVPNIRSYNARMRGLALAGKTSEVVELIKVLETKGTKPDIYSFNALIKGLCNDGDLEGAMKIHKGLTGKGLIPNALTFQTLIPCFCEKEDFEVALQLCRESLNRQRLLPAELLQTVVDGLVKKSNIDGAKELVNLGRERRYGKALLKMPADAE